MIFNQYTSSRNHVRACNFGNLITTIDNSKNYKTWKATKDCWLIGCCGASTANGDARLYINDTVVVSGADGTANSWGDRSFTIYVHKGTEVKVFGHTYIKVFGCY